jgi:PAB1-binding protein PBP1
VGWGKAASTKWSQPKREHTCTVGSKPGGAGLPKPVAQKMSPQVPGARLGAAGLIYPAGFCSGFALVFPSYSPASPLGMGMFTLCNRTLQLYK